MINCSQKPGDPTWDALCSQVARMERMEKFPFGKEAKRELAIALCNCNSLEEAEQCVSDFVQNEHTCPTAADIRRKIYDAHQARDTTARQIAEWRSGVEPCPHCGGSGYRPIKKTYKYHGQVIEVEASLACDHKEPL